MRLASYSLALAMFYLSCSLWSIESGDPLIGRRHVEIDGEFVYVKRAPKIHNRQPLCQLEDDGVISGVATEVADTASTARTTFAANNILSQQKYTPGLRLTISYLTNRKSTWEWRYLGLLHWKGSASASFPGSLEFPFETGINNTVDFQDADSMKGSCDTRYWSGEWNYWYHVTPRRVDQFSVSWLVGVRYIYLSELFNLVATSVGSSSRYKIETKNRISGPEVGGDIEINLGSNFTCGVRGKAGLLVNFAQNKTRFRDDNNTRTIKSCNPSDFNGTFFGEIAPFFLFNLAPKVLFKASYELTYLSSVALAMNQITFQEDDTTNLTNQVSVGGSFMFYGGYVGIGFMF